MPLPEPADLVWSRTSGAYGSGSVSSERSGMSAVLGEVALDVFDDDDGVVYHEAGRERDAEEGQRVNTEAKILMKAKVPMSETGMVTAGMMVARQSCRKRKMTTMTIIIACPMVVTTSLT